MTEKEDIRSYTAEELRELAARGEDLTDWEKVDSLTEADLERLIAEDPEERDFVPDWTQAKLVVPQAKQSVHLRLDRDIIEFFKAQGKGHITRMQTVLRAYVDAHRNGGGTPR